MLLLALNIAALYSLIPHQRDSQIVENTLEARVIQKNKHIKLIVALLEFLLTHNPFSFNGQFLSDSGTS